MKIDSPDITHKSDVGGVRLGVSGAEEVRSRVSRDAWLRAARRAPEARLDGVSVEPMATRANGRELMAGIVRDLIFGPAVTFGAGRHRSRGPARPRRRASAAQRDSRRRHDPRHARGTDAGRLPQPARRRSGGARRGTPVACRKWLCELPEIEELDINPLIADENGVHRRGRARRVRDGAAEAASLRAPRDPALSGEPRVRRDAPRAASSRFARSVPRTRTLETAFVEALARRPPGFAS